MSVYYLPSTPIRFDLVKGMTGEIHEVVNDNTAPDNACLTDGKNCIWAERATLGNTQFSCYAGNDPDRILSYLARRFHVAFVSEFDPGWSELAADYDYVVFKFD